MNNALAGLPAQIIGAFDAGQEQRDRRERRNALNAFAGATTPEAQANALTPLIAMGDFETVGAARTYREQQGFDDTRRRIAPAVRAGRFGEAARDAAGSGQVDLAAQMMDLDRSALAAAQARGERASATIFAALQLPADQRQAYFAQHTDLASELGIPPEALANADYSDDTHMRALASRFLDVSKLAGDVSLQKFGDRVETVRTGPTGSEVLDSREIPVTRAEQFERQQFGYRQQQDATDNQYRQGRAEAEDAYRRWQMENSYSRSDIEGQVLRKAIEGGAESLTPEERAVYDRAVSTSQGGLLGGYNAAPPPGGQPAPAPAPARAPAARPSAPAQGAPARPQTDEEFNALPPGALYIDPDDGQTYRKGR